MQADVGDQARFSARPIRGSGRTSALPVARERDRSTRAAADPVTD
jgi:hypothetical protein